MNNKLKIKLRLTFKIKFLKMFIIFLERELLKLNIL